LVLGGIAELPPEFGTPCQDSAYACQTGGYGLPEPRLAARQTPLSRTRKWFGIV